MSMLGEPAAERPEPVPEQPDPDGPETGQGQPETEQPERPELQPLPYDGVLSVTVGTVAWLVALIVMLPFTDDLRDDGHLWWIATAATGFGLGLLGIAYCVRRRDRLRRAAAGAADPSAADPSAADPTATRPR